MPIERVMFDCLQLTFDFDLIERARAHKVHLIQSYIHIFIAYTENKQIFIVKYVIPMKKNPYNSKSGLRSFHKASELLIANFCF